MLTTFTDGRPPFKANNLYANNKIIMIRPCTGAPDN